MNKESLANKKAWEYRAYEFWVKNEGLPAERAKDIMENPMARLKQHGKFFCNIKGLKIANPCGSNGRRAVALALLGADVTVFDISEENKKYALELADCSHVKMNYIIGDLYDVDMNVYGGCFDMLYLEGGILHYFHDIDKFMETLFLMLKPNGQIILNDFHPFRKVMPINFFKSTVEDYFDTNIHNGDVAFKDFLDEAENEEFPSWTNKKLPGEFTVYAIKGGELKWNII